MLRQEQADVPKRGVEGPRRLGNSDGDLKSFSWRGRRIVEYAGPLPSLRPHLAASIARTPHALEEEAKGGGLSWLLAEPESFCLATGIEGSRANESKADRAFRFARRKPYQEAVKIKALKV